MPVVTIRWEGIEQWENSRHQVDRILEKHTGHNQYPATKSLPPIIFGVDISEEGIKELKALDGVVVRENED
ncbi:unnamed protein product [Fusarium venenatum]|uniref:Inhibitor I9 domain-containing protein n=1 Tax=Fusarium venenatum TaxID=56646 RepID=A0A2L2SXF4_9HYPO|nr:uncharacterized protein FVRRES_05805 [Fusarium venenatum]CEI61369.1 unnamed protein product [Fusarium venenatum]